MSYEHILNDVKKTSPVPIRYDNNEDTAAFYHRPTEPNFIRIEPKILDDPAYAICVMAHEIQHAKCWEGHCKCVSHKDQEQHAMLAELKLAYAIGDPAIARNAYEHIDRECFSLFSFAFGGHHRAAVRLTKNRYYKACKAIANRRTVKC